jgi:antitoxin component of RelBE/YafQ-DinJ toxin-antitoxin module
MVKVSINVTVDKEVLARFKKLCSSMDIKVSTKINSLMREWNSKTEEGKN